MGELWLVRHGETHWSRTGQHTGRTDVPLTPHGEKQARSLRPRLDRPWTLVLTSPLVRASKTAELAGLAAMENDDLLEWDYGHAEGRTTADLNREQGGWSIWTDRDLPETPDDVGRRAERLLELVAPALAAGDVCLVGHGHALRILAAVWLGLPAADGRLFALSAGAISVLGSEHELPVVVRWNT
ncbi:MAG: histidine phosphatase family protein [Frankiaceae bacterium]|nr:histidine phosphatase family protein [Frankiaceae bacterium]